MKKILFILFISFCSMFFLKANAQISDTTSNMNIHKANANSFLQKSKKQKKTGWILAASGIGITVAGVIHMSNPENLDKFFGVDFTGLALTIGGVIIALSGSHF